jgi:hypothetical protein
MKEEEEEEGFLAHIESKGNAEPFKVLSVDELMELMMSIKSSQPDLSNQISKLLKQIGYYAD